MKKMNVVIIDDEQDAVTALSALLHDFTEDALVTGTACSALEGIKLINRSKPDVVFLDISMPGGNGFDLLDVFPEREFRVIFTTASSDFALKAIKVKAVDYLLKPIDPDELQQALNKVKRISGKLPEDTRISLPDQNGFTYVRVKEIIHVDGDGNYTTIHYAGGKKAMVSRNIKYFEQLLIPHGFFRCHQSHIVNPYEIKQLKKNEGIYLIMSNGNRVDVSRTKKDELIRILNS